MINTRKFSTYLTIVLIVLLFNVSTLAQFSQEPCLADREYVVGVGDRLTIVESSSGRTEQVGVRPDGRITVQGLEETLLVTGLKISILEYEIERRFLKYIKEPQVTISLAGSPSADIQIQLRGAVSRKLTVPRGTTFGRFLNGIVPQLQQDQIPIDLEAIRLIGGVKSYKLTEQSLSQLRGESVPEEVLIKLKDLEEQEYTTVKQFVSDLEKRIGRQTSEYRVPILQYAEAVREICAINGTTVMIGRDVNADIRLEWSDEIFIPSPTQLPPDVEKAATPPPHLKKRAQFTLQEYDEFQENYPAAQEILQPPIVTEEEETVYIDLDAITPDQINELGNEAYAELLKRSEVHEVAPSFADHITLMGITVNLVLEDLKEAFLAFSGQDLDERVQIESFQEGDIVEKGGTETDDIVLEEIQEEKNQIILKKGEEQQVLTLAPKFSDITLSGILAIKGTREAVLENIEHKTPDKRKRFKEGNKIEGDILLAEISKKWVLLEKGEDFQLVFLRDPSKRVSQASSSAPLPGQDVQVPGTESVQEGQTFPDTSEQTLSESLQMLDPSVLEQLQSQSRDLLMSPAEIARLLAYNGYLAKFSQTLSQSVSLTEILQPMFRLARERTGSNGDPVAENRAAILILAMYVNGKNMGDLVGIGGAAPRPRQVQVTLVDRPDLAKHFLVSAAITGVADSEVADMVGLSKEVDDSKDGSGFSFPDLTADRAGVRFAELATGTPQQAQLLQQQMSEVVRETDFMPQVDRLPEGMMEAEFQQRYQDTNSDAYRLVNEEIDRRIAACRIYQ